MLNNITNIKNKVLAGNNISQEEAIWLATKANKEELYFAATEITQKMASKIFDICSIINAKSGKCPENCKWCSQSIHNQTQVETYDLLSKEKCLELAKYNEKQGVMRFSIVTSGKKLKSQELEQVCNIAKYIRNNSGIKVCASLGLLEKKEIEMLATAGISRYHCNLETAPSYFSELCSTHTIEQKLATLNYALSAGMEICTGGIIGMGENLTQLVEFAFAIKDTGTKSVPINLLNPIVGTPLENQPKLTEEYILTAISIFRFIMPEVYLRFAGGRAFISKETMIRAMRIGINSAIVGDMLTTIGCDISADKNMIKKAGYNLI